MTFKRRRSALWKSCAGCFDVHPHFGWGMRLTDWLAFPPAWNATHEKIHLGLIASTLVIPICWVCAFPNTTRSAVHSLPRPSLCPERLTSVDCLWLEMGGRDGRDGSAIFPPALSALSLAVVASFSPAAWLSHGPSVHLTLITLFPPLFNARVVTVSSCYCLKCLSWWTPDWSRDLWTNRNTSILNSHWL